MSPAGISGVGAVPCTPAAGLLEGKALGWGLRLTEQGGHSRVAEQTLRCCLAFVMDQDIPSW